MASWVDVSQMLGARGITQRNVPMRSKLLIGTAALLAGIAVASAQNMPGGGQSGGAAQDKSGQAQPGSQPSTKGQRGQRGQMDQTTGKSPQEQKDQNAQGKDSAIKARVRPRPSAIKVRRSRGSPRSVSRVSKANRANKASRAKPHKVSRSRARVAAKRRCQRNSAPKS